MTLYAESSAVLAWLLGEKRRTDVRRFLREAETVLASDLTLVECERVLIRARTLNEITKKRFESCRNRLKKAAERWQSFRVSSEVVDRARQPFPSEPVRTLDAIHLATALLGRTAIPELRLLTLDERIRSAARQLDFTVVP